MPDGSLYSPETPTPTNEVSTLLDIVPDIAKAELGKCTKELEALSVLPQFVPEKDTYSIVPEIIQTARYLVSHQTELMTEYGLDEIEFNHLLITTCVDDFGKLGPHPIGDPENNPENIIARFYREIRWTSETHNAWITDNFEKVKPYLGDLNDEDQKALQENRKGRTLIPLKAALFVASSVAKIDKNPEEQARIDNYFKIDADDQKLLDKYELNIDVSFSEFATTAHTILVPYILTKRGLPEAVIEAAPTHHLSSGLHLLPKSTVEKYGFLIEGQLNTRLVQQSALIEYLDKVVAFACRSPKNENVTPETALEKAKIVINNNLQKNFLNNPNFDEIKASYDKAFKFLSTHPIPKQSIVSC